MDQTTLKAPGVQDALNDYVKVKFQAEDLGVSPAREVMERFEAIGLPAYAILRLGPDTPSDSNGSIGNYDCAKTTTFSHSFMSPMNSRNSYA